jgi:poly(glycerol-phosphate) alpha-glucosyltransferase
LLHALNETEAAAFRAYGLSNPICIIPNGVDIPNLGSPSSQHAPWHGVIPEGGNVLLFLGRLHHKKNIAALINAWSVVAKLDPMASEWWLVIAGWDQLGYEANIKKLAARIAAPRVIFIGPQHGAEKEAAFRWAGAFVLPSLSEGLPRAVLEAWSYALPVVMTTECNLSEGFGLGAAIEIQAELKGIIQGLRRLISMSAYDRVCMGQAGRKLVENKFTWPRVANQMAQEYKRLAKPSSHS